MPELIFLKLGGSLITDKTRAYAPRLDILQSLAGQIAAHRKSSPNLPLLLGHGSGSFGHTAAKAFGTRDGFSPTHPRFSLKAGEYWGGFAEVWYQASRLNRHVLDALHKAGTPGITFSPAAGVWAENRQITEWDISRIQAALENGILPIVHGDVIFDKAKGGTILSTEELFAYLAQRMHPTRILLAGLEDGVYADFPARKHKVREMTRELFNEIRQGVGAARGADVTGGMLSKVQKMLELVERIPNLTVQIFSGEKAGNLEKTLKGEHIGTIIHA
ncbi:MAG: isopentenyl phosphate kinase [Anaerolineales bacterium]